MLLSLLPLLLLLRLLLRLLLLLLLQGWLLLLLLLLLLLGRPSSRLVLPATLFRFLFHLLHTLQPLPLLTHHLLGWRPRRARVPIIHFGLLLGQTLVRVAGRARAWPFISRARS